MSSKLLQLIISLKDEASAGLNALSGSLGSLGGMLGGALIAGLAAAAAGVVALGASSVSVAAQFQNASATFASVAGGSLAAAGFSMEDVKNKALEMGAQTQFSAAQAQEAMINLAKGGVPIADIMGQATQATLDLAAAGEVELGPAADIVSKQLGIWASTGVTAADVANTLAQAANASTVDVEELALGLANVGGVAKVSGVSFQDLNQTMAMIAPGFSSASDAGTSLKTFFLALQPTTKNATAAMQDLGLITTDYASIADDLGVTLDGSARSQAELQSAIYNTVLAQSGATAGTKEFDDAMAAFLADFQVNKFYDATGAFIGMDQASGLLHDSLQGLTQAEQSAALKAIFGTDAFRAAALIAEQGAPGFQAMGAAMDAAGTAAEQAAIRNATFKFAWDSLLGTIETIQIVIGSALLPVLTSLVNDALIPAGNAILAFVQGMIAAADPVAFLAASLNAVVPGLGTFVGFLASNLIPILAGIGAMILYTVVPSFYAWATSAIAAGIGTAIAMLPVTLVLLAIGAAVALLVAAWQNNWGGIQEKTAAVIAFIQPYFEQLVAWLSVAIPAGIAVLAQLWTGTLWPALQVVGTFIMSTLVPALVQIGQWLATNIPAAVATVVAAFTSIITTVQQIVTNVQAGWALIVSTTQSTWATVVAVVTAFASSIGTSIQTAFSTISTIVQAVWNTIVFLTSAAWGAIVAAVSPGVSQVVAVLQTGWAMLSSIASAAWAAVVAVVAPAIASVAAAVSTGVATVQAVWAAGWAVVQAAAAATWAVIQSVIAAAVATVQSVITSVISFITSTWTGAQTAAQTQTTAAWTAIQTIISGAMTIIRTAIAAGVAVVQSIMATAWAVVVAAAQNDFGKIPAIISAGWEKIKSIMSAGVGYITAVAGQMAAAAMSLGKNIVSGIISGVGSMGAALGDKLKSMAKGALDAAKSALGIKSPSTVMAQQVGAPIAQGVAQGIQTATPKATQAMAEMAGKLVGLVTSATGAFGALANIGTIPQGAVSRFSSSMMTVVQMLDEINVATRGRMMASAMQITGGANKVLETIVKGVDAFAKLETMGAVPQYSMQRFSAALMQVITELDVINVATRGKMMASATQITAGAEKVVALVGAGADAFAKLSAMGPVSVASVQTFADALGAAIAAIGEIALQYSGSGLAFAQAFAESAGKIMAVIGPAVDGLNKLRTMGDAVPGSFAKFALYMSVAVLRVSEVAQQIDGAALAAAVKFADGASKVVGILGSGVDGLTKLATLGDAVPGSFAKFATYLVVLVSRIAEVAALLSTEALSKAAQFADAAGKVIGILGSGVDGFKKLADFQQVAPAALMAFTLSLSDTMSHLTNLAGQFDAAGVAAAGTFAESAGKIVGIIGSGVDGFTKLADFERVAPAALMAFTLSLSDTMSHLTNLAGQFDAEGVLAAGVFSESAGKVVGIISNAVGGLAALKDMGPVSQQSLDLFAAAISGLMQRLSAIAVTFAAESLSSSSAFADAAGKSVGILKTGVEGLLLVNTFTNVSLDAMTRFGDGVRMAVAKMAQLAAEFGVDATASALSFAKTAGEATDFLKKGVDGFKKLGELQEVPQAGMQLFADGVIALVNTIVMLATVISTDVLAEANRFSNAVDVVITVVLSALKALTDMGASAGAAGQFAQNLVASINTMAQALATQATPAATDIGFNLAVGIANGITAGVPAIQNAVYAAVNAALAAARAALGIASPSKVFDELIGQQAGAGLAQGLTTSQGAVAAAATDLASVAIAPVSAGLAPMGATSAAPINIAPRAAAATASSSSSSVTIERGAISITTQPGQNNQQIAELVLKLVEQRLKLKP